MRLPSQFARGERLKASDLNLMLDGIKEIGSKLPSSGIGAVAFNFPAELTSVYNTGENDIEPLRPAGIVGQVYEGSGQESERITECVLNIVDPTETVDGEYLDFASHYVIAAEPVPSKRTGKAWINGICPAYIISESDTDLFAELEKSDIGDLKNYLTGGSTGSSRIIWKAASSASEQIAYIRLGFTPSSVPKITVQNKSGETAPDGAFIEVYDHVAGDIYYFRKPTTNNKDNVYVLCSELADDEIGEAWERGITAPCYVLVAPAAGQIVGAVANQWYGQVHSSGTFVAVADEYVTL